MAFWREFHRSDPTLAGRGEQRIDRDGLVLVGTLRDNGWPRMCPVEPLLVDGELYPGTMRQSEMAVDLLRDPRCVVHTTIADKAGTEGDVKIYGRAVEVTDDTERERYGTGLEARIGWRPGGELHLFCVDITEVGFFAVVGDGHESRTWRP